jgi:protein-disulfide isomerase/uncharacterized membrane protein
MPKLCLVLAVLAGQQRPESGKKRWAFPLLVGLAALATLISLMLTSYHLSGGKSPGRLFSSVCGVAGGGCSEVLASPWATLPGGVPLAALGVAYYGALTLWYLIVGRANRRGRVWQGLVLAVQVLGAVVSLTLIAIMVRGLHAICAWCAISHAMNFALLVLAWLLWPRREEGEEGGPARPGWRLGLAGLLLMVAWSALTLQRMAIDQLREIDDETQRYARTFYDDLDLQRYLFFRAPAIQLPIRPDDPVRGNPAAPHTAVVFSDFQCPACREFAAFEASLRAEAGDRLRIVYKHFPLDPACNPGLPRQVHPNACEASYAAEAVRELGGNGAFWRMHDLLFQSQDTFGEHPWAALSGQAGVNGAAVAERVARQAGRDRILEDAALGRTLGLRQTPTVYLDGRRLESWSRAELWKALLGESGNE